MSVADPAETEGLGASAEQRGEISAKRLIAACTIGNALEFFDFVVFSFFARTIGALFFPAQDPTAQLLFAFATYGVGFLVRPVDGAVATVGVGHHDCFLRGHFR